VTGQLKATIPPKADLESQEKASENKVAVFSGVLLATPQGLLCLIIAQVGFTNSVTKR
jgi:hypothetical protein